jgi:hypothetical protein
MSSRCSCEVGPGKFEGEGPATFIGFELVMISAQDETTGGDGTEEVLADWIRGPIEVDDQMQAALKAEGYCRPCIDTAKAKLEAPGFGGLAVWQDGQGFVYSESFDTKAAFDKGLRASQKMDKHVAGEDD